MTTTRRYTLNDADKWLTVVSEDMRKAGMLGLYSAALRTVAYIQTDVIPNTKPHAPVDTHAYAAAWKARRTPHGANVENTSPYATIIEDGARPGFHVGRKMVDAIAEWVLRKGLQPNGQGRDAGGRFVKVTAEGARQIAWAIATKIARDGLPAKRVLARAEELIPRFIREEVRRELSRL